jgi:uncharacterized protein (DUF2062 family)
MRKTQSKQPVYRRKLKQSIWPERGFRRPIRYYSVRILRLRATPRSIAAGVAAGVASSFTPFVGLHFFLSIGLAWMLRGSLIASALGTVLTGNPITWPFIWAATWEVGNLMLGQHPLGAGQGPDLHSLLNDVSLLHLGDLVAHLWRPIFEPMLLGSIPIGIVFGGIAYGLTFYGVKTFQDRRRERLEKRMQATGFSEIDPTDIT